MPILTDRTLILARYQHRTRRDLKEPAWSRALLFLSTLLDRRTPSPGDLERPPVSCAEFLGDRALAIGSEDGRVFFYPSLPTASLLIDHTTNTDAHHLASAAVLVPVQRVLPLQQDLARLLVLHQRPALSHAADLVVWQLDEGGKHAVTQHKCTASGQVGVGTLFLF